MDIMLVKAVSVFSAAIGVSIAAVGSALGQGKVVGGWGGG